MEAIQAAYASFDAAVGPTTIDTLRSIGWMVDPASPLTKGMFAIDTPSTLIASLLGYGVVVGTGCAYWKAFPPGKDKKPDGFALKALVMFHNVFLVALSAYMCFGTLIEARRLGYSVWGNAYSVAETTMAHYVYVFYVSKIYEFADTFIMILKGNLNQVSFLHVYHHVSISFIWWMIARLAPGGDAYFSLVLNSWVHVCMYTYYLLATLIKQPQSRKKYLWWGKYLTMMQMAQFAANFGQAIYAQNYSPYPKFLSQLLFWYMLSLLGLFGNFFYQKHMSPKAKRAAKESAAKKGQ